MISFGLLVIFLWCGLVYSRASKEMVRLDKLRLEREPPDAPKAILGAATEFMRKMGLPMAPGGDELKAFCARNGLSQEYDRANNRLLGSIVVAVTCVVAILWLGGKQP
jgi:hypothetical protein